MDDDGLILELDSMELESFSFNSELESWKFREVWTSTPRSMSPLGTKMSVDIPTTTPSFKREVTRMAGQHSSSGNDM